MPYLLTDEQFKALSEYFELAFTAVTNEEQEELVFREYPCRDIMRSLTRIPD